MKFKKVVENTAIFIASCGLVALMMLAGEEEERAKIVNPYISITKTGDATINVDNYTLELDGEKGCFISGSLTPKISVYTNGFLTSDELAEFKAKYETFYTIEIDLKLAKYITFSKEMYSKFKEFDDLNGNRVYGIPWEDGKTIENPSFEFVNGMKPSTLEEYNEMKTTLTEDPSVVLLNLKFVALFNEA